MATRDSNSYDRSIPLLDKSDDQETYRPRIFSLNGRLGRVRYMAYTMWLPLLVYLPTTMDGDNFLLLIGLAFFLLGSNTFIALVGFAFLLTLVGTLVVVGRRLHDLNMSRWFSLLMLIPLINFLFGLYLMLAPGTNGRNRFGPMPGQNGTGVIVVACIVPAVFIIGILAAIAIPQYAEYTKRAKAAQQQSQPAAPVQIPEASE